MLKGVIQIKDEYLFLALYSVKDGSGALLWAAFFGQAIKSGNVQPDP
jgi:hypothetical protein